MPHTRAWDNTVPANSEAASQGASRIRDFRGDVSERMSIDHVWADSLTTDGYHKKVTLTEQAANPASIAEYGIVFTKDVSGITELFYIDSAGTVSQLTNNGKAINPISLAVLAADPAAVASAVELYTKDDNAKAELFVRDEDGNIIQLTSAGVHWLLKNSSNWTKSQAVNEVALTDAATVAIDASLSNAFSVTLGGNRTLGAPTNAKDGQVVTIRFIQDATGSRTITLDASYKKVNGLDLTLSTAAAAEDLMTLIYLNSIWRVMSLQKDITSAV